MNLLTRTGLLLVAALALATPARAANLDKALLDNAPDMLAAIKKADIKSVGVLPFTIKRGTRPAAYDTAPLAAGLPGRLENAFILRQTNQEDRAIKVLRDTAGTAAKAGVGAWTTSQAAFKKLFATKYELAWGDSKLQADAFLTGEVRLTGDRSMAEVVVRYVKADSWKDGKAAPVDLVTFKVRTDRSLLRDAGYNTVVDRALIRPKAGAKAQAEDLDTNAIEQVTKEEVGEKPVPDAPMAESHTPESFGGMKFEIEYDGVKQEIASDAGGEGAKQPIYTVPAPKPGQQVVMYLTRQAEGDNMLGVVLRVNGKSTFGMEDADPTSCRRWLFDPKSVGKREDYTGYYRFGEDGKLEVNKWKALDEAAAKAAAAEMGNRAGFIDIDVFTSRPESAGADDSLLVSTRSTPKKKPATLKELRHELAKSNFLQLSTVGSRHASGLLLGDVSPVPAGEVKKDKLPNPVHLGGISIRYLPPATSGKIIDD